MMLRSFAAPLILALALAGGCSFEDRTDENDETAATESAARRPAPPQLVLEVDIASRQLNVYRGGQIVATHPVAVGSAEWPTPTGEWTVEQVIFNPRWHPPEESWAEDEEIAEPGDPDNPLGRAQLVYRAPNSIHGTNDTASLGKAVSHGSIRVANEVAVELARMVMQAGGAPQDEAFVQRALTNPTERMEVIVPRPVPIRVVAGPVAASLPADTADSAAASR